MLKPVTFSITQYINVPLKLLCVCELNINVGYMLGYTFFSGLGMFHFVACASYFTLLLYLVCKFVGLCFVLAAVFTLGIT